MISSTACQRAASSGRMSLVPRGRRVSNRRHLAGGFGPSEACLRPAQVLIIPTAAGRRTGPAFCRRAHGPRRSRATCSRLRAGGHRIRHHPWLRPPAGKRSRGPRRPAAGGGAGAPGGARRRTAAHGGARRRTAAPGGARRRPADRSRQAGVEGRWRSRPVRAGPSWGWTPVRPNEQDRPERRPGRLRRLARAVSPRNALAVTFWLLVGAAVIGAAGVLLAALFPEAAGVAPGEFVGDEAYRVQDLTLKRGYLELVFPDAHLVPVYRGGEVAGAVLVGSGRYVLGPRGADRALLATLTGFETVRDNVTAAYVSMDYRDLENARYSAGGRRDDNSQALERARQLLENRRRIHPSVAGAGMAALFR